nr:hypothetical protein C1892_00035 [Pseudomonas sp. MPBD7-1]
MIGWRRTWPRQGSESGGVRGVAFASQLAPTFDYIHPDETRSEVGASWLAKRPVRPPRRWPADPPPATSRSSPSPLATSVNRCG